MRIRVRIPRSSLMLVLTVAAGVNIPSCERKTAPSTDARVDTLVSESQLASLRGHRIRIVGIATESKATAYINSDTLPHAIPIERNWYWPAQIVGKRVDAVGEVCWQEPYTIATLPADLEGAASLKPGLHVPGYYYLKAVIYTEVVAK